MAEFGIVDLSDDNDKTQRRPMHGGWWLILNPLIWFVGGFVVLSLTDHNPFESLGGAWLVACLVLIFNAVLAFCMGFADALRRDRKANR